MSSCFLCDTSYDLNWGEDDHTVYPIEGTGQDYFMKFMPIMVGSAGTDTDDQQHEDNGKQNYVSYRVKKIEFRAFVTEKIYTIVPIDPYQVDYILIFKVPFRNPIFDYSFRFMENFMLYSEPENVLKYVVHKPRKFVTVSGENIQKKPGKIDLIIDKPFIVGPNDYVGVLYMFGDQCRIDSSAKVWFDIV